MVIFRGGCTSSRLDQELEISIIWEVALAIDLIRCLKFAVSGEAAPAVDSSRELQIMIMWGGALAAGMFRDMIF